jgi:hypothetical protein
LPYRPELAADCARSGSDRPFTNNGSLCHNAAVPPPGKAKKAKKAGATEQELAETTLVAAALRAGGAVTHGLHTLE